MHRFKENKLKKKIDEHRMNRINELRTMRHIFLIRSSKKVATFDNSINSQSKLTTCFFVSTTGNSKLKVNYFAFVQNLYRAKPLTISKNEFRVHSIIFLLKRFIFHFFHY